MIKSLSKLRYSFCARFTPIRTNTEGTRSLDLAKPDLTLHQISSRLFRLAEQSKRYKVPWKPIPRETQDQLHQRIMVQLGTATFTDLANLVYFQCAQQRVFNQEFRDRLFEFIRGKVNKPEFETEISQTHYVELLFNLIKLKAYPPTDPIWTRYISCRNTQEQLSQHHLGLMLWSLASLHRKSRSKKSALNKAISEQWNHLADDIIRTEMNFYTTSLIMQSLCTMNIYTDQVWDALTANFLAHYSNEFDGYALTHCLWALSKYLESDEYLSQSRQKPLPKVELTEYLEQNLQRFTPTYLLLTLWSVQRLGFDSERFWSTAYGLALTNLKSPGPKYKIGLDDISLAVQVFSLNGQLSANDWTLCQELTMQLCSSPGAFIDEQSIVGMFQAFALNKQGTPEFWECIQKVLQTKLETISVKSIATLAYSLVDHAQKGTDTLDWLVKQFNTNLQAKRVPINNLAVILWSLAHHDQVQIDFEALAQCLTSESLSNSKAKDLAQLTWSLGYMRVPLHEAARQALHDALVKALQLQLLNPSDVTQLLQSVKEVFRDEWMQLVELLLSKYARKLNAGGVLASLLYGEVCAQHLADVLVSAQAATTQQEKIANALRSFAKQLPQQEQGEVYGVIEILSV